MTQHISRRELKKDEVREKLVHGAEAVLTHQRATLYILIAAVVVAAGVFGWKAYVEHQTVKATAAFDEAMKVFSARIRTAGDAQEPSEVTYVDEKNKYSDAAQKFGDVAAKYPHTHPGQLAVYFAALSDEKIGKNDDAQRRLQGLASGSDDFSAMARF